MNEPVKVDAAAHLQKVLNDAAKFGLFQTTAEAITAQGCLSALVEKLEVITVENAELKKKYETPG